MIAALILYACAGGTLNLPAAASVLADRADGGNLVVKPPRPVWERSALRPDELTAFGFLVAAAGEAMLAVLPQLEGGCINLKFAHVSGGQRANFKSISRAGTFWMQRPS